MLYRIKARRHQCSGQRQKSPVKRRQIALKRYLRQVVQSSNLITTEA